MFPNGLLNVLKIESYAAFPLFDTQSRPLGLIAIADRKPMRDPALLESVLKIFAARASSEMERQRGEHALRTSEEQYRAIFNSSVDGMKLLNPERKVVDANPACLALFGYSREELITLDPETLLAPESRRLFKELFQVAGAGESFQRECLARRRDGQVFHMEMRGVQMHYQGRPHILCIARDITARKRA
jgi:PAS domain S-box-containing protein